MDGYISSKFLHARGTFSCGEEMVFPEKDAEENRTISVIRKSIYFAPFLWLAGDD
jgi:hypothetical protein